MVNRIVETYFSENLQGLVELMPDQVRAVLGPNEGPATYQADCHILGHQCEDKKINK